MWFCNVIRSRFISAWVNLIIWRSFFFSSSGTMSVDQVKLITLCTSTKSQAMLNMMYESSFFMINIFWSVGTLDKPIFTTNRWYNSPFQCILRIGRTPMKGSWIYKMITFRSVLQLLVVETELFGIDPEWGLSPSFIIWEIILWATL